jgi:peptidoglycan/xylan/chitin deacetylase (PgdA/CDA1 family)
VSGAGPEIVVALLARPGADTAPALEALRAAGVPGAAVVGLETAGGWAAARNAALAAAADADVLALVEEDVRVDPGWGAALREAWAMGDAARVGAIGGPLRAAGTPAWLTGDQDEVLALHGAGRGGPFPSGNVAFRVAALRGVGGFFPARGHRDARDTVGDDHRAQHELVAVGWELREVPGLSAARDLAALTPTELLRRRLRAGARSAALGAGPSRRAAAVLAGRSGAAAALRALRRDRAGALDRAAWAAHGAGAVLGRALAHAELQPDRPSTPLRPAVPAPAPHPLRAALPRPRPRPRRAAPVHGAVLLYHRVAAVDEDPLALAVSPAHFAQQLAVLRERWTPAPLAAVLDGSAGPHAVALTFDDGYHDNLIGALPALRDAGVPATLFASTGHVAAGEGFWWDEVTALLGSHAASGDVLTLELPEGARAWAPSDAAQRTAVRAQVHAALQTRDRATIAAALARLRVWAGLGPAPSAPPERDRPMTVAELRELASAAMFDVQAHGRTHVSLAHAPAGVRDAELRGSAEDLEAWLGPRPTVFSYPFGVPGADVDAATRAAARAAGYAWATVNVPGLVGPGTDRFAIPRLAVPDVDGAAFARWLHAALPGRA